MDKTTEEQPSDYCFINSSIYVQNNFQYTVQLNMLYFSSILFIMNFQMKICKLHQGLPGSSQGILYHCEVS